MMVLLLKWLGNTAELQSDSHRMQRSRARTFLAQFLNYIFDECGATEVLESYRELVKREVDEVMRRDGLAIDQLLVVPLRTGADHIGRHLARQLDAGMPEIRPLLFTRAMAQAFGIDPPLEGSRFEVAAANNVTRYLKQRGVIRHGLRHVVFVDAGQRGTIRELLEPILNRAGISCSLLVLYHGRHAHRDKHLAYGLNDESSWTSRASELKWYAFLLDDGLETDIEVPRYVIRDNPRWISTETRPSPRRWFRRLVRDYLSQPLHRDRH
jgi:hypothetical protein